MRQLSIDSLVPRKGRARLVTWGVPIAALILALAATPWLIGPACPQRLVIATGSPSGAYSAFAEQYRERLARDGIELEIRHTEGSMENTKLLMDEGSGVSLAIIQGGTADSRSMQRLKSLASLYREPLWVFYRGDRKLERLTDLRGRRIAVGVEGSGTRALAIELLRETNVADLGDAENLTRLISLNSEHSAAALKSGRVDAAFFVISPHSPLVLDLMQSEGVQLMSFRQADAFHRRHPYLSRVTLSEGVLDPSGNMPPADVTLLAPTANLVARGDLHPALAPLFVKAAEELHRHGSIFEEPGEFPSMQHVEYPMHPIARRYFKAGPSLLFRYLPFWAAARVNQMKLFLLPLCTLLIPLIKTAPPIYRWRIRSRIYRWYRVLREVDQKLRESGELRSVSDDVAVLERLEEELAAVNVPLSYMEEFYNLRLHTAFVLDRLRQRQERYQQTTRFAA